MANATSTSTTIAAVQFIAGPAHKKEEILYAEVDTQRLLGAKWMFDVAGHYVRPDIFSLSVHTEARPMLTLRDQAVTLAAPRLDGLPPHGESRHTAEEPSEQTTSR